MIGWFFQEVIPRAGSLVRCRVGATEVEDRQLGAGQPHRGKDLCVVLSTLETRQIREQEVVGEWELSMCGLIIFREHWA